MALPEGFSEWEHLQHTVRKVHNNAVKDFFKYQPDLDISTPKASAKHACLFKDEDTAAMTTLRMWLFWVICRKMRDNFEPYYGIPVAEVDSEVRYKPQITCFFLEHINDVDAGYRPVEGQLSVRLINETSNTVTASNLQTYATRVNNAFGKPKDFIWKKGKELYSYVDKPQGHRFKVLTRNKTDAIEIVNKLLDITNDSYKSELLKLNEAVEPTSAYPTVPPNHTILGKTYKEPRKRPIAEVRFLYASIKIWGLPKPIILVDKTGYWSDAIISNY